MQIQQPAHAAYQVLALVALDERVLQHLITCLRRHQALPGKPDFTFGPERAVVFVDGRFWHGCPKCYRAPTSNETNCSAKISGSRARYKRVAAELRRGGWRALRFWEHELRTQLARVAGRLRRALGSQ